MLRILYNKRMSKQPDTIAGALPALSKDGSVHVTNELINTITSIVGGCFALLGSVLLIAEASMRATVWHTVGFSIYGLSLMGLFVFSTLHHGLHGTPKVNQVLRTFDYVSIFFLIGGTVTPLVLVLYRDVFGWSVLGVVWAIVALGISLRASLPSLPKYVTNTFFIVLGWLPVVLLGAGSHLPLAALALLAAGGIIYSAGFVLFIIEKPNILPGVFGFHELWHCLVITAAACHYFLMYSYVLPR